MDMNDNEYGIQTIFMFATTEDKYEILADDLESALATLKPMLNDGERFTAFMEFNEGAWGIYTECYIDDEDDCWVIDACHGYAEFGFSYWCPADELSEAEALAKLNDLFYRTAVAVFEKHEKYNFSGDEPAELDAWLQAQL